MHSYWLVLWAALAMVGQDVLGTLLVQSEARNKASLAGLLDTAAWLLTITTVTIAVTALQGHSLPLKAAVVGAVSAANFTGTWGGTRIGQRFIKSGKGIS